MKLSHWTTVPEPKGSILIFSFPFPVSHEIIPIAKIFKNPYKSNVNKYVYSIIRKEKTLKFFTCKWRMSMFIAGNKH